MWNALRAGFYKTVSKMYQPAAADAPSAPLALKETPETSAALASSDVAAGGVSIRAPTAPPPPPSIPPTKSLAKFIVRTLTNIVHGHVAGNEGWGELNLHRKLDFTFIVLLSVSYAGFASWSLLNDGNTTL